MAKTVEGQTRDGSEGHVDEEQSLVDQNQESERITTKASPIEDERSIDIVQEDGESQHNSLSEEAKLGAGVERIGKDDLPEPLNKKQTTGYSRSGESSVDTKAPDHRDVEPKPEIPGVVIGEVQGRCKE